MGKIKTHSATAKRFGVICRRIIKWQELKEL